MKITQRIPNFVDGGIPKKSEFETVEELLNLDWVKRYRDDPIIKELPFYQYSKSEDTSKPLLMIEYKDETDHKWCVVGYLRDDVDLPIIDMERK